MSKSVLKQRTPLLMTLSTVHDKNPETNTKYQYSFFPRQRLVTFTLLSLKEKVFSEFDTWRGAVGSHCEALGNSGLRVFWEDEWGKQCTLRKHRHKDKLHTESLHPIQSLNPVHFTSVMPQRRRVTLSRGL